MRAGLSFVVTLFLSIGCLATLTYTARTDPAFIALPAPLPSVGAASGANAAVTEPGYATVVVRATDIDTLHSTVANWQEFSTCCGGWADINAWNSNSTMFLAEMNGGLPVLMSWSAATLKAAPVYAAPLSFNAQWWSYSNPNLVYGMAAGSDPVIASAVYSNPPATAAQPAPVNLADLATAPNCLPSLKGATKWSELSVAWNEQRFAVSASAGAQDTAQYVAVWDDAGGCRWYDTLTGQMGGNWGPAGVAAWNPSGGYLIHGIRLSGDGQSLLITPVSSSPCGANCNSGNFRSVWKVNSLAVNIGPQLPHQNIWQGHFTVGYNGIVNNVQYSGDGKWCNYASAYTAFTDLNASKYLIPTTAACAPGAALVGGDQHQSWNDDDSSDTQPVFTTTAVNPTSDPAAHPWQNEILAFSVAQPGTVWREASTYNTGTSSFFSCQYGIGTISQDGKWFVFTSDWGKTLGLDSAGKPRCDVFVAEMH